jgi:hypothetical protein
VSGIVVAIGVTKFALRADWWFATKTLLNAVGCTVLAVIASDASGFVKVSVGHFKFLSHIPPQEKMGRLTPKLTAPRTHPAC